MAQSIPILPNELWMLIIPHLSQGDLAKCYGINRFLLNTALNAIYGHFKLFGNGTKSLDKMIEYLIYAQKTGIRQRITTIELDASQACIYDPPVEYQSSGLGEMLKKVSSTLRRSSTPRVAPYQRLVHLAQELMLSLPNLHTIIIRYLGEQSKIFLSLTNSLWSQYVDNKRQVRHLTFDGPSTDFGRLFPISSHTSRGLQLLESLTIILQGDKKRSSPSNFHYDTGLYAMERFFELFTAEYLICDLQSLSIHFREPRSQQASFSSLFSILARRFSLPYLKQVSITTQDHIVYRFEAASRFLNLYRRQIMHLRISPQYTSPTLHPGGMTGPPFIGFTPETMESLEHLEIQGIGINALNAMHTVQVYILNSTRKLTSLRIHDSYPLYVLDTSLFLRAMTSLEMSEPNPYCTVSFKTMSLHLHSLAPAHFRYFSRSLPNLQTLHLKISTPRYPFRDYFNGCDPDFQDQLEPDRELDLQDQFLEELAKISFDGWNLEELCIRFSGVEAGTIVRFRDILLRKLPSLKLLDVANVTNAIDSDFVEWAPSHQLTV